MYPETDPVKTILPFEEIMRSAKIVFISMMPKKLALNILNASSREVSTAMARER